MKKRLMIPISLFVVVGLTAFGYISVDGEKNVAIEAKPCKQSEHLRSDYFYSLIDQSLVEIYYNVDSRFMMELTKEDLAKKKSLTDFHYNQDLSGIISYDSLSVIILDYNYKFTKVVTSEGPEFSEEQLELLNSVPYSTDVLLRADFQQENRYTGKVEDNYTTPHITVIPEKEAVYSEGMDGLVNYVKDATSKYAPGIEKGMLLPGKVRFTVSAEGNVIDVFHESTGGYEFLDKDVLKLISNMPGTWVPAENSSGEKVDQQFVFSFGIGGC